MSSLTKLYLLGKMLDPELVNSSSGQLYLRFSIYANHEALTFTVFEKRKRTDEQGVVSYEDEPLFKLLSDVKDGTSVMALLVPSYNQSTGSIRYFLRDIYVVEPYAGQVINSVLSREAAPSPEASSFKLKR